MPLSSLTDVKVLFVSLFTNVTVAPGTTAPEESVTVPRNDARNWASTITVDANIVTISNTTRTAKLERFMECSPRISKSIRATQTCSGWGCRKKSDGEGTAKRQIGRAH